LIEMEEWVEDRLAEDAAVVCVGDVSMSCSFLTTLLSSFVGASADGDVGSGKRKARPLFGVFEGLTTGKTDEIEGR